MQRRLPMLALLTAFSLAGLVLTNVAPALAQGQSATGTRNVASLDFQQADVREALRKLFRIAGVSYTIAPDVQGTVTLSLRNVPFDTALQNLTRQVDATYRIEGGVYQVIAHDAEPLPELGVIDLSRFQKKPSGEPFMLVDGNFLFAMHDGVVDKVDKRTMKVVGTAVLSKAR